MLIPTPFHSRTAPLCEGQEWRGWSGYLAAASYEAGHEREYYAIRNAAALIDVSPLFKYELSGPDALKLVNRVVTRNMEKCRVGQVRYSPWCDDDGHVIDDGTISRLAEAHFRLTAADTNLAWLQDCGYGMRVEIADVSQDLAALAIQGPNARKILQRAFEGVGVETLKYYHLTQGTARGIPITITRTGYTGDLGYELWVSPQNAGDLWDMLVEAGRGYGLLPAGMVALDIARIEAGLLLIEVDYKSSRKVLIPAQKSSPFELGLGWAVDLDKPGFVGREALLAQQHKGLRWKFVGMEVDWPGLEGLYARVGLAPQVAGRASRSPVPVYKGSRQVGQATSQAFSPILKKYIALATLESQVAEPGTTVEMEITVEYKRLRVKARVVKLPFFDPPRKRDHG